MREIRELLEVFLSELPSLLSQKLQNVHSGCVFSVEKLCLSSLGERFWCAKFELLIVLVACIHGIAVSGDSVHSFSYVLSLFSVGEPIQYKKECYNHVRIDGSRKIA